MAPTPTHRAEFWRDPALPYAESRRACHSRACYRPHSHPIFSIGVVDQGRSCFTGAASGSVVIEPGTVVSASQSSPEVKMGLGLWMFCVLLLLDILIAAALGNTRAGGQFGTVLPWLERVSGGVLIVLALGAFAAMFG